MTASLIALMLAVAKAVPYVEQFLAGLTDAYIAYRKQQNQNDENRKDDRNDAAVDAAAGSLPKLCPTCPFARNGGGQHGSADAAPAVQGGSASGT